jgi:hypothetical protein
MRSVWLSVLLLLVSAGAVLAQGNSGKPSPRIAFEESAVTASGLTPGKIVVWFGVEHRVDADYSGDIYQFYRTGTAAADGTARLELDHAPAPRSFWVAVDLDSGAFDVKGPNGYRLARPARPPRLGSGQQVDELLAEHPSLMGLMVRPGEGAWAFSGGDGGPRDEDGKSDGHLRLALDKFDPLPGSPAAPARIKGTDLWFAVDPMTMEISRGLGGVVQ